MTISGKAFSTTRTEIRLQNPAGHPPVVIAAPLKANSGTYNVGTVLKFDADGVTRIPFVTGDAACAGGLDETIDTTTQASGNVVIHGGVVNSVLTVRDANGNDVAPTAADLKVIVAASVFPQ